MLLWASLNEEEERLAAKGMEAWGPITTHEGCSRASGGRQGQNEPLKGCLRAEGGEGHAVLNACRQCIGVGVLGSERIEGQRKLRVLPDVRAGAWLPRLGGIASRIRSRERTIGC
jgi:hypothetical protein